MEKYQQFNGYLYEYIFVYNSLNYLYHLIKKIDKDKLKNDEQKKVLRENYIIIKDSLNFLNNQDKIVKNKINHKISSLISNETKLIDMFIIFFEKVLLEEKIEYNKDILIKNISVVYNLAELNSLSFIKNIILNFDNNKQEKLNINCLEIFFTNYFFKTIHFNVDFHYQVLNLFNEKISVTFKNNFGFSDEELTHNHSISGHFLNSDFLMQINKYNVNNIEDSIKEIINMELSFDNNQLLKLNSSNETSELFKNYLDLKEKKILNEVNTTQLKSLNLNINNEFEFLEGVWGTDAFDNFIKNDKSYFKLIQSTSYISSYVEYLNNNFEVNKRNKIQLKIFSNTSTKINSINLNNNFRILFEKVSIVGNRYKEIRNNQKDFEKEKQENNYIYKKIDNFLTNQFIMKDNSITKVLSNFNNTNLSLRTKHTIEFRKRFNDGNKIINLLGNPGIGKTTSLVSCLYELDTFCVIYLSSRTAVNLDIFNKVSNDVINIFSKEKAKEIYNITKDVNLDDYLNDVICLTTNKDYKDDFGIKLNKQKTCDILNEKLIEIGKNNIHYFEDEELIKKNKNKYNIETNSETNTNVKKDKVNNHTVFEYISEGIKDIAEHTNHKKIVATVALQGYNNVKLLFKLLSFLEVISENGIKNCIFMTDELTGAEQTSNFIQDLLTVLYKNDDKDFIIQKSEYSFDNDTIKIPKDLDIRVINSDASISNEDALNKYLTTKFSNSSILFKKLNTEEIDIIKNLPEVYTLKHQNLIIKPGTPNMLKLINNNTCLINVNSYPASELIIKYIFREKNSDVFLDLKSFNDDKFKLIYAKKVKQFEEVLKFFEKKIDTDESLIYYLQNKDVLKDFQSLLSNNFMLNELFKSRGINLKEKILIIDTNSLKEKDNADILQNLEKYRIFLITSTVSRGISFKNVTKIIMEVPDFDKESQLNELVQTIYRGRGGNYDTSKKELVFFITNTMQGNIVNKLDFVQSVFIIQGMIENRLSGYYNYKKGEGYYNIIPNSRMGLKTKEQDNFNTEFMYSLKNLLNDKKNTDEIKDILEEFKSIVEITVLWLGLESLNDDVNKNKEIVKQLKKFLTIENSLYNIYSLKEMSSDYENFFDFMGEFDNEGNYLNLKTRNVLNINNKVLDSHYLLELEKKLYTITTTQHFTNYKYKNDIEIVKNVIEIFINNNKGKGHEISEKKDMKFEFFFFLDYFLYFREYLINNSFNFDFQMLINLMIDSRNIFFKAEEKVLPLTNKNINFKNDGIPFIRFKNSHIKNIINEKYNNHYISNINSIVFLNIINSKVSNV